MTALALVPQLTGWPTTLTKSVAFGLALVAVSLGLAQLSYRFLERGVAEHFRRWLLRRVG